ncbi:MAG TPA: right-handed parallel beta-helix repeat-containing protein, partial [Phnomibacter sp.]|nr:right-handed parallel beta-helix repeat-containing protein [Phnomibacter sp.]
DAANASYVHCTIAGNTSLSSNTTIIGNAENASPSLVNCIIAGSAQPVVGGTPQITYSLVQGETVFAGLGNRNGNPHFENEAAGNLQLTSCSWAVNAGITVNIPTTDILGRPRNAAGGVDMGAYELQTVDNSLARLYVRPAATGNGVGNSWANAFTTVAAALARANDCARVNEVWVSQGIYYPTNGTDMLATFRARSNLSVYGGFAGTESGLHQRNLANRSESVLSGNLLQDANIINNSYHVVTAATGDTMTLWDGFTIRDGFAGVTGSQRDNRGAGIFVAANNQTFFRNCIISNNTAHAASAIYAASSRAVFTNCVITNNNTQLNDGVVWNDNASPTYFYCSIASNTITGFGLTVMRNSGTSSPRITNCIIRGLSPAISGGTPMVGYSIIQNNTIWPGSSNSNADPLFVNEAAGNLRLRPCSPAINGGSPILFVNSDLLDNSRPMGGAPDIGAYERPISNILYVNATALPGGDGSSWNAALTSLQDALRILYCPAIEQIWVARGTYRPASNTNRDSAFIMRNNLAILGGFAGTETQLSQRNWRLNPAILSGDIGVPGNRSDNSHNIISNNNNNLNATAILDGFIIRDGQADKNEYARIRGGGMFNLNSSPLVRNCIFTGNFSNLYGGAVFNQGAQATPTFINCVFSGNQAQFGGGIYNESAQTQVINCTFSSNLIIGNGGGIYSYGTPKAVVRNSIVWGNAINGIFTATIDNSTPIEVSHSIVQGGYEGTNNINQNPRFTIQAPVGLGQLGDLRLLLCSPGTNAGSNAAVPAGITTDLFGLGRIVGNAVDMGAFERQTSPAGIDIYVDATATNGTNEGTSWVNAFTNLQAAINDMNFCPGTVDYLIVHIAANTYTFPPEIPIALNSQNVRIFGGYPPGGGTRNFAANPVILKGNIQALKNATIDGVRVEKP